MTSLASLYRRPLSIGNVINAALQLYRTHFRQYLGLALQAALWWLIPIYGWARSLTTLAQLSRLGFRHLLDQPERPAETFRVLQPRLWSFLGAGILHFLLLVTVNMTLSFGISLSLLPVLMGLAGLFGDSAIAGVFALLLQFLSQVIIFVGQIWVQSRLFVYDIALAMERSTDATQCFGRSWTLTRGSILRIQGVILAAYLISTPLFILACLPLLVLVPSLIQSAQTLPIDPIPFALWVLATLVGFIGVIIVVNILLSPLWQAMKAVLYYDLRCRREGLDFGLRTGRQNLRAGVVEDLGR
ncbi:hypothetical protein XM38_045980 [Halomicronema hongdechloris C2206]|uniref:DUF975 domain-containing protein n=1 Tax=Halomicronema hongdechloris C2206 TaxID=1641165 RepID=A0A1Z3HU23_9CYAN|nr:hypothetical protein [Halomicronema hongdechloris]ASC73627.1 hypothetical protein XM38_045980 [Halomicronema hongdechloris C2206]